MSITHTAQPPISQQALQQLEQELETLLSRRYGDITEQQLLSLLKLKSFSQVADSQLALFQVHFVLYHLLYRIAARWAANETAHIEIGLARIKILPWQDALPATPDTKAAYYAEWQNYWRMTPMGLTERLNQFWQFYQQRYLSPPDVKLSDDEALRLLALQWPCSQVELKKAFRKQSLKHHPDRGGDQQAFVRITLAYKKLLTRF
ncbi:DNA-J related domain-containing protein [Alishewanella sp. SMS8]|uniref:DNA-J related domain-containing protein n=1 Tax=unclassified Alishewanella TaxID=2628974 RepID=UPI002740899E|nr:DNA-J related domain-containing protein [Alishewanella sp. SMS8]MDP5036183.1 DnaJ domain-containing protein [Alishewanella sp.]MDP5187501.1 DnaJ domain-containing protein [Alishewanella sp.]MDP5460844.1 DNA-J related domain-containing protein [Alishewanella sp. SMS8]